MKNMNITNNKAAAVELYNRMTNNTPLHDQLMEMQDERGISGLEAEMNNRRLFEAVSRFYSGYGVISEQSAAAFEEFLDYSKTLQGYDRTVLLHQLYFGLKVYQNEEMAQKMLDAERNSDSKALEELFRDYYEKHGRDPSITKEVLERDIRRLVSQYRITPAAMRLFIWKLEHGGKILATSAALAEEGYCLKCLQAMELYLDSNGTLNMDEAVTDVCLGIDAQAAADACSTGCMMGDVTEKILHVVTFAMSLQSAYYFLAGPLKTPTVHAALEEYYSFAGKPEALVESIREYAASRTPRIQADHAVGFRYLLGSLATWSVSESVAKMAGKLSTGVSYTILAKESQAAQAMEKMAQWRLQEQEATRPQGYEPDQRIKMTNKNEVIMQQNVFG